MVFEFSDDATMKSIGTMLILGREECQIRECEISKAGKCG